MQKWELPLFSLQNPLLIVVAGATASGKTALAIALAQAFGTEIISADARQLYAEMRIGTAVPSAEELQAVKHHFIQTHSIHQPYDVAKYATEAGACLQNLFQKYPVVVAVGGSGLYLKALCEGLDTMPDISPEVREYVRNLYKLQGIQVLVELLQTHDQAYYEVVDKANPHRLMRALEVCLSTGQPFSTFHHKKVKKHSFQILSIAIDWQRELLYERINQRAEFMLRQGLIEEAEQLLPYKHKQALQTVGYKEVFDYLAGRHDYATCVSLIKQNTRHYAKRQLTWFRKEANLQWISPQEAEMLPHLWYQHATKSYQPN